MTPSGVDFSLWFLSCVYAGTGTAGRVAETAQVGHHCGVTSTSDSALGTGEAGN